MKRITLIALAALMCMLSALPALAEFDVSQAGLSVAGTAQQLGKPKDYGSAKVTADVPQDNPMQDGVNPITGESWSGSYQPVLVNIDSHPRALPHWGVASADLIYELPIQQDGSTRQVALFMSEYPASAGPVRSARIPMASLAEMWGAPYYFFGYQGGTTSVKDWVKTYSAKKKFAYPYVELMNKKIGEWYVRTNDSNHVAPYNVALNMDKVRGEYAVSPQEKPFLFDETGLTRGEDAPGVIISYKATSPAYLTAYQYNDATGLYERYRNGEPYTDAITGESTAFANVIVVRTDVTFANNNPSRPVIRLNGQGVCEIFQNGRYIRGTWVRSSGETKNLGRRMIFLDENGEELPMKVGKTFIQIVDNEQPVIVISEDAIEGSVEPQEQRLIIGDGKAASTQVKRPRATPTPTPEPTATPTPEPTPTPTPVPEQPEQGGDNSGEQLPEQGGDNSGEQLPEQGGANSGEQLPEQGGDNSGEQLPEQGGDNSGEQLPEQGGDNSGEQLPEQGGGDSAEQPEQPQPEQSEPEQPAQPQPEQSEPEQPEQSAPEQPEQPQPEQSETQQVQPEQSVPEQPEQTQPEQSEPAADPAPADDASAADAE